MTDESLKALWQKADRHSEEISKLHTVTSTQGVLIQKLESEFARARLAQAESNAKLETAVTGYNLGVQDVLKNYHEQQGAARAVRWTVGVLIAAAGVIATLLVSGYSG